MNVESARLQWKVIESCHIGHATAGNVNEAGDIPAQID